ncbi:retrotransposon protein [Tanacetum coccineum]|uniref:Retrotransposon protein n=1 Tax=Tanacetum coccineum TaxID=301880 RepID=A0ABQ5J664_9ASTR
MTRSSTKELITPFENPKSVFRSKRRLFETPVLVESSSPELDLFSDIEEHSEKETTEIMTRWPRNEPSGSITNWETLKIKFLNNYCPHARTTEKIEEINNFQQEPDESLFRAWEKQILDFKGAILTKTTADAKITTLRRRDTLEEAYYIQFGAPYQPAGQYRAAGPGFYQRNNRNSSCPDQRQTLEESLTKFMAESAKRHRESSNIIKEIQLLPMRQ